MLKDFVNAVKELIDIERESTFPRSVLVDWIKEIKQGNFECPCRLFNYHPPSLTSHDCPEAFWCEECEQWEPRWCDDCPRSELWLVIHDHLPRTLYGFSNLIHQLYIAQKLEELL